jgi:phosphoribosylanthranilate isomerase
MALKVNVKISEVNNLTEARYCAGMGVQLIGFPLGQDHPRYLSLSKAAEITGWIAGMDIVAELNTPFNIQEIQDCLHPHYIQLEYGKFGLHEIIDCTLPVILKIKVTKQELLRLEATIAPFKNKIKAILLESDDMEDAWEVADALKLFSHQYPLLLGFGIHKENIEQIINTIKPWGISIKGQQELKTGLNNFEGIAEILEILEIEE